MGVAQLVERGIVIPVVAGSIPVVHPNFPSDLLRAVPQAFAMLFFTYCQQRPRLNQLFRYNLPAASTKPFARVAELVDALVLGTSVLWRGSSSLPFRTIFNTTN